MVGMESTAEGDSKSGIIIIVAAAGHCFSFVSLSSSLASKRVLNGPIWTTLRSRVRFR